ncbi:MAG: ABC transporter ATP-binding protein [Planctomycetota bacterium]|nr:ABC transporter ATP-binding protein [Planctomycetota bacterium]MDP6502068.1 ABC transporter ATP-binding protein [Planctomycetota bacterium]
MGQIIELDSVTKDYGQGEVVVHALRGVDLVLEAGEFTAMAGPSGSGKSTLLNIVGGLDNPTSGNVNLEGEDMTRLSRTKLSRLRRDRVGFVFQSYNLIPILTAMENAEYILMLQGISAAERKSRVNQVLNEVGLAGLGDRFPRELSGGQQQRVAIARAIAAEPALVLADEPTANVDSQTAGALLDLMVKLNEEKGITFLFSTHDQRVMDRARRLLVLTDGKITHDGSPEHAQRDVES